MVNMELMYCSCFILAFFLSVRGQTIDQIIMQAMNETDPDVMHSPAPGVVQVEMDMLFNLEEYTEMVELDKEAEESSEESDAKRRVKRKAIPGQRWTNKIVPWTMQRGAFSSYDQAVINKAMGEWEKYTCIRFQRRSNQRNYITYVNGGGCSSYVGMSGTGSQPVTLARGCRRHGTVVHELGHAIGFHHEQTRPDRDGYVTIMSRNIQSQTLFNFQRHSTRVINSRGVPYDYRSVMHYGQYAFSSNGQPTIYTKDRSYQSIIGTAAGLSFRDIKLANIIYSCSSQCGSKSCPGEGFLAKDCTCWCPGNPVKQCDGTEVVVTVSPVTTAPVTTRPNPSNCRDKHSSCRSWAPYYCRSHYSYMKTNCARSCNYCSTTTTTTTTNNCHDLNTYCTSWARYGYCHSSNYRAYMSTNCKKSCNNCRSYTEADDDIPVTDTDCVDYNRHCKSWAKKGQCWKNPNYMLSYCKVSCDMCGPKSAPGSSDSECQDVSKFCGDWADQGYCQSNAAYMDEACKESCNKCGGDDEVDCSDGHRHCEDWARRGYCRTNAAYMHITCKKSCNKCPASSQANQNPNCSDNHHNCSVWASVGYCNSNTRYMRLYCKQSCHLC